MYGSNQKTAYWFSWLVVLFGMTNCTKDTEFQYFVQSELQPFFDKFYAEGTARGKVLDMESVSGVLGDLPAANVLGRCEQSTSHGTVTIDQVFWDKASYYEKEYVVFHELGHCVLDRRHLEDQRADGSCVSMMQSGSGGCRMSYNAQTRSEYLDELFQ